MLRRFGGDKIVIDYAKHLVPEPRVAYETAQADRELKLDASESYVSHPWKIEYGADTGLKFLDRRTNEVVVDPGQGRGP
ncbi:MAG: hypothetical protein QM811_08990 [Pirellulales bacterium]